MMFGQVQLGKSCGGLSNDYSRNTYVILMYEEEEMSPSLCSLKGM